MTIRLLFLFLALETVDAIFIGKEKLTLGRKIGKGGEGEVYLIEGKPNFAAKLYYENIRLKRKAKVDALVKARFYQKTALVSFPREMLLNSQGEFVGFSMKLVYQHLPMHELYTSKSRHIHYPGVDYRFLVRAACNLARAVAEVHASDCIIGDFNHSGALISKNATVALIDADSFQFNYLGETYLCEVGMPEFTPPELQRMKLTGVVRNKSSDLFGLAVAVFQLLFLGKHPYAGLGGPEYLEDAIKQNCFAYSLSRQSETKTQPPPRMFKLSDYPVEIVNAFELAFGKSSQLRPSAESWVRNLVSFEKTLKRCATNSSHYYPNASTGCLWCGYANRSSREMFPSPERIQPQDSERIDRDIANLMREIKSFEIPILVGFFPEISIPVRDRDLVLSEFESVNPFADAVGVVIMLGSLLGMISFPNPLWLILTYWGYSMLNTEGKQKSRLQRQKNLLERRFKDADNKLKGAFDAFLQRSSYSRAKATAISLEKTIALCENVDEELKTELRALISNHQQKQRDAYLDRFRIQDAGIGGIGPSKIAKLRSFGIETAADVSSRVVMAVPGFGKHYTSKMVSWRKHHEAAFKYNNKAEVNDKEQNKVRSENRNKKLMYLSQLKSGLEFLRSFNPEALRKEAVLDAVLMEALEARAVVESDLKSLGITVPRSSISMPDKVKINTSQLSPTINPHNIRTSQTPLCPKCGLSMVRRLSRNAPNRKRYFWGCSRYPMCKGTRSY